jgi:peptide/nickel transport system substrate-binding protein
MLSAIFSTLTRCRWFSVLLTCILAIALSACNPAQLETKAAQVPQLVQHIVGEPKTFNYALSQESPNVV